MINFPNAKINIGLNIVSKRDDGFHNIETIFYPIALCDALEIIETKIAETTIQTSGINLDIDGMQNICIKAYQLLAKDYAIPPVEIYLHKFIPSGAGLGGGSADGAYTLKMLNTFFNLNLSEVQLQQYAAELGSDCAFFVENKPVFAQGRGEIFETISLDLSRYYIYLIKPDVFVSTAEAYRLVKPGKPEKPLCELINYPIKEWKCLIFNDFEKNIFTRYPELEKIKTALYQAGAVYASMSGSGSSIFGIFDFLPEKIRQYSTYFNWISKL